MLKSKMQQAFQYNNRYLWGFFSLFKIIGNNHQPVDIQSLNQNTHIFLKMNRNRASILFYMGFVVMAGFLSSGLLVQL